MFGSENKSHIKIGVSDEGPPIKKEIVKKINKPFDPNDNSNFALSKMLIQKLGGDIWMLTNQKRGNTVYFSFDIDYEQEFALIEEDDMDVSDYSSSKDGVNSIPNLRYNSSPCVKEVAKIEIEQLDDNSPQLNPPEQDGYPNILLVDDNYFNIEVLKSLIEVQLNLE